MPRRYQLFRDWLFNMLISVSISSPSSCFGKTTFALVGRNGIPLPWCSGKGLVWQRSQKLVVEMRFVEPISFFLSPHYLAWSWKIKSWLFTRFLSNGVFFCPKCLEEVSKVALKAKTGKWTSQLHFCGPKKKKKGFFTWRLNKKKILLRR